MKPVYQTRVSNRDGNCWAAAIASLLEVPIEKVDIYLTWDGEDPNYQETWWVAMNLLLAHEFGKVIVAYEATYPAPAGYAIAIGKSKTFKDVAHAVVVKDGVIVHDPNPEGKGLDEITAWEILVPIARIPVGGYNAHDTHHDTG